MSVLPAPFGIMKASQKVAEPSFGTVCFTFLSPLAAAKLFTAAQPGVAATISPLANRSAMFPYEGMIRRAFFFSVVQKAMIFFS